MDVFSPCILSGANGSILYRDELFSLKAPPVDGGFGMMPDGCHSSKDDSVYFLMYQNGVPIYSCRYLLEKSNSSGIYKRTYSVGPPIPANWQPKSHNRVNRCRGTGGLCYTVNGRLYLG